MYKNDTDTGTDTWWSAEVSDIDPDSDKNNPKFFIYFPPSDTEVTVEELEYHLEPLLEWYLEGWVRFRDSPSE